MLEEMLTYFLVMICMLSNNMFPVWWGVRLKKKKTFPWKNTINNFISEI